jgi:hypothetical protein
MAESITKIQSDIIPQENPSDNIEALLHSVDISEEESHALQNKYKIDKQAQIDSTRQKIKYRLSSKQLNELKS